MKIRENSIKVNGLTRPVIDTVPQFSWKLTADKNGEMQDAYRVLVSESPELTVPVWDTGFVASEECANLRYAGKPLSPATRYYFSIAVKSGDELISSGTEYFDTGKRGEPFCGIWITGHDCRRRDEALAAPYLRRVFDLSK